MVSNGKFLGLARAFLFGLVSSTGAALAIMPPGAYADLLSTADIHLQLKIIERDLLAPSGNDAGYGTCGISGIVVHVFRGPARVGDEVSFGVPCVHEGAQDSPVGGAVYTSIERLGVAEFLEVVLTIGGDGIYALAAQGMGATIIEHPSTEPVIDAGTDEPGR